MNLLKKSREDIFNYWNEMSAIDIDAQGLRPTARDPYLQEAIEAIIERHLEPKMKVLDIGCGDGVSTVRFAQKSQKIVGTDFIDRYVKKAQAYARQKSVKNAVFRQGNVLDLKKISDEFGSFDAAITIRCLINLPTWEDQSIALREIAQVLKPGGLYIFSEGWKEGMEGLSRRRQKLGLEPIQAVEYNKMICRSDMEDELEKYFDVVKYQGLGLYMFLSRVLQPLYRSPKPPQHDHHLNRIAGEIQLSMEEDAFSDCDYAGVYILHKK